MGSTRNIRSQAEPRRDLHTDLAERMESYLRSASHAAAKAQIAKTQHEREIWLHVARRWTALAARRTRADPLAQCVNHIFIPGSENTKPKRSREDVGGRRGS